MYLFMLAAMGDVAALDALLRSHPGMLVRRTGQDGDLLVAAAAKGELAAVRTLVRTPCLIPAVQCASSYLSLLNAFADVQNDVNLQLCVQVETHGASVSLPATLSNGLSFVRPAGLAAIPAAKLAISPLAAALCKKQTAGEPIPAIRIVFQNVLGAV